MLRILYLFILISIALTGVLDSRLTPVSFVPAQIENTETPSTNPTTGLILSSSLNMSEMASSEGPVIEPSQISNIEPNNGMLEFYISDNSR